MIINGPSYLSIILAEEVFHLVGVINYIICFRSGRISPQFWEVFHKPTTSLFVLLLVFQRLRHNLLERVLSKLICGRSWHFLLHSVIPMIYLLFFLPETLWCCSLHSSSHIEDHVLFVHIHLTEVLCHLFKFFSSYQVLHLFSTGVLSEFDLPCSLFILFQPEWFQFLLVHCTRHS